jgi:prevent-host-death family protein
MPNSSAEADMPITTMTSREFNQDTSGAKKAARRGPVFITDRGRPAHVLLTIGNYQRLARRGASLADVVAQEGEDADFDFDPPRLKDGIFKPADFD